MASVKQSTLPTVLKEYVPDYEPVYTISQGPGKTLKGSRQHKQDGGGRTGKDNKEHVLRSSSAHSQTSSRKKTVNAQKFEAVAVKWELAKSELRHERHQQLQEKLGLQQHLLRLQDELSRQRREQAIEHKVQEKQAERSKKQAQNAALEQVCRQSLAEDRKAAYKKGLAGASIQEESAEDVSETSNQQGSVQKRTRRRTVSKSPTLSKHMTREEENEEEEDDEVEDTLNSTATSSDFETMPWHHQQLHRLYGNDAAEYFIHPKIEPQAHVPLSPKLKKTTGHVGANELWGMLRGESEVKLLREDRKFPPELKDAYSAFARESLNFGRIPVDRNFTATADVPDMQKLLDQSLLRNVRKYRHKTGLMYRASQANHDRTNILLFNSPLPDITEGDISTITRYMPSWTEYDIPDSDRPEYMKWLPSKDSSKQNSLHNSSQDLITSSKLSINSDQQLSEVSQDEMKVSIGLLAETQNQLTQRSEPRQKSKLLFLTERDTTSPGEFAARFRKARENKNLPTARANVSSPRAQTSQGFGTTESENHGGIARSASVSSQQEMKHRYTSDWQPLSMTALVEYKQQRDTDGVGDFQNGRMKMWPAVTST